MHIICSTLSKLAFLLCTSVDSDDLSSLCGSVCVCVCVCADLLCGHQ